MAEVVGFTLEVDGLELIFKNLEELKKFTKEVNQEFQQADKGTERYNTLNKTLGALKQVQAQTRQETRNAGREFVIAADKGKQSYRAMNAELVNLRDQFKNLSRADREGDVGAKILSNITKLDTELKQIDASIGNFQRNVGNYKQALLGLGDVVSGGLLTGGIQQLATELGRVLVDSIRKIKEFEVAQKELQSITGLTEEGLASLSQEALNISTRFGTAATEVLKGFQIIGSKKPELLSSAEALATVTEQAEILAKASGLTLPQAADVLTKSLNQFGAGADQAREFVDILATSQQRGTATVISLGESLKNVGSVLDASNISFEQGNVLLQALAKGGIEGAEAGTKLRGVLIKLAKTGRDDLNPATNDFNDILDTLSKEVTSLNDAIPIFETENAAAALTLIKQRDVVASLTGELSDYGNALSQANNNTDTLQGSLDKASASFDNFVLSLREGQGVLSQFSKGVVDTFSGFFNSLRGVNEGLVDNFELTKITLKGLFNPFGAFRDLTESTFAKAGTEAGRLRLQLDKLIEKGNELTDPIERQENAIDKQRLVIKLLEARLSELTKGTSAYNTVVQILEKNINNLAKEQQALANILDPVAEQERIVIEGLKERGLTAKQISEQTGIELEKVTKLIGATTDATKELTEAQRQDIEALKEKGLTAKDIASELGVSIQKVNDVIKDIKIADTVGDEVDKAASNIDRLTSQLDRLGGISSEDRIAGIKEKTQETIAALVGTPEQIEEQRILLEKILELEIAKLVQKATEEAVKAQRAGEAFTVIDLLVSPTSEPIPEEVAASVQKLLVKLETEIDDKADEVRQLGESIALGITEGLDKGLDINNVLSKAFDLGEFDELFGLLEGLSGLTTFDDIFGIFLSDDSPAEKIAGVFGALNEGLEGVLDRSEERAENEIEQIEKRFEKEIQLAEGNTTKIKELEKQKDSEIEKVEKEAFERSKRIKVAQAGTSLAEGIVNILSAPSVIPDPFGAIYKAGRIAFLLTTFAQQIASINAAKFAEGGFTGPGKGVPDSTGKRPAGIVHEKEYVVPEKVLAKPEGRALVQQLEDIRVGLPGIDFYRSRGFYIDGGIVNTQLDPNIPIQSVQVINNVVSTEASFSDEQIESFSLATEQAVTNGVIEGTIQSQEELLAINDRITRLENTVN